jgi:hypothetical protein
MHEHALVIEYDTTKFPFAAVLAAQVFGVARIDQLHCSGRQAVAQAGLGYADNLRLRALMEAQGQDSLFSRLYHLWVARVLAPHYGGRISYSRKPKMRVHLAGTGGVSNFHRDADITERSEQINIYLPFTDVYDTCTVLCEQTYGGADYQPLNLQYGQALLWDGGRLMHGTVPNETATTRVSCDFRFTATDPARVKSPWCDVLAGRPPAAAHNEICEERSI